MFLIQVCGAGQVRVSAERRLRAGDRRRDVLHAARCHVHRLLQDSARISETGASESVDHSIAYSFNHNCRPRLYMSIRQHGIV